MGWLKRWRRRKIHNRPTTPAERWFVESIPFYQMLPIEDRDELKGHVKIFLHEKRFEGCGGLAITDEIRVTIAAGACILLLHRETDYYPGMKTILVYPQPFVGRAQKNLGGGTIVEGSEERLGEAWHRGPVILSWEDVRYDMENPDDGHNVIFHEFAHQIDSTSGQGDNSPVFRSANYVKWVAVLQKEFENLRKNVEDGRDTFLDEYGAESPAEFFAVATEAFFEQSREMGLWYPELYEQMKIFYQQDPGQWVR